MRPRHAFFALLTLALGCSEEFNPVIEGERPYVVFALMNGATETQIVRVHETSPPGEQQPGSPPVIGAQVQIVGPTGTIVFRDTVLTPPVGSPDTVSIPAFVASPFTPQRGQTYRLEVTGPRGNAVATVQIPGAAGLSTTDFLVLQTPYAYETGRSIVARVLLSPIALGYVMRLLIEYERLIGGVWTLETVEVPVSYRQLIDENTFVADYPNLIRRSTRIVSANTPLRDFDGMTFRNSTYLQTLSILYGQHGKDALRMKRALFIATQADEHFFTYYSFANFFQDRHTIRVDQPDYSNVEGALGFFGSMTNDTLAFPLPPNLAPPDTP